MTIPEIYAEMRARTRCRTNVELMNYLQDRGLVSDNSVNIEDVANSDLMKAFNEAGK